MIENSKNNMDVVPDQENYLPAFPLYDFEDYEEMGATVYGPPSWMDSYQTIPVSWEPLKPEPPKLADPDSEVKCYKRTFVLMCRNCRKNWEKTVVSDSVFGSFRFDYASAACPECGGYPKIKDHDRLEISVISGREYNEIVYEKQTT